MSKHIQVIPSEVNDMRKHFLDGIEELKGFAREVNELAQLMEDGALRGEAGSAFTEVLRQDTISALDRMSSKFDEMAQDLQIVLNIDAGTQEYVEGLFKTRN